ncbi:MAG: hypothetical protein CMJ86_09185 [Planctomycetes bacterium]|nr:hypothetical protein [Planctomycetota bacterium]
MRINSWMMTAPGRDMELMDREATPGPNEVLIQVVGCGVCHTDLGFFYDGVPTRHALPLTLGHEISGHVLDAGPGAESWVGKTVIVPAVIPCGECAACLEGEGSICPT